MGRLFRFVFASMIACFLVSNVTLGSWEVDVQATDESENYLFGEIHEFDDLITEEYTRNSTLDYAFYDYKLAVDLLSLHDVYDASTTGVTPEEAEGIVYLKTGDYYELNEDESYLVYEYDYDDGLYADLLFYFIDQELYYIGLADPMVNPEGQQMIHEDEIAYWVEQELLVEDLVGEEFNITGLAQMYYGGVDYHLLTIPTTNDAEEILMSYVFFYEDTAYSFFTYDYFDALDQPHNVMLRFFAYFFDVTDEYPTPE